MAKASRVAARQAKTLERLAEVVEKLLAQQARLEARLDALLEMSKPEVANTEQKAPRRKS